MSTFSDYAASRGQRGQQVNYFPEGQNPYIGERRDPRDIQIGTAIHGGMYVPYQPQPQLPVIDTSNAIGSLAQLLGPTPAEREAQELRRQQGKAKMQMWAGLFDGLRQLGNLYAATKSATPQRYTDNPYQQVEQMTDAQRQREDALTNYGRQYYASLYNMQRQLNDDKRRNLLAEAQANYYNTRDEVARMKAENDRLKNEKYVQLLDGRIAKVNAETGKIEKLLPYQEQEIQSRTAKNNRMGYGNSGGSSRNNGTYGYEKRKWVDDNGVWHEERVPTTGTKPGPAQPQQPKEPKSPQATRQKTQKKVSKSSRSNNNYENTRKLGL